MDVYLLKYGCTRCDFQQIIRKRPYRRVASDGSSSRIATVIAWCHDQGQIVESEEVPSLELLESLLGEVEELVRRDTRQEELEDWPTPDELRREIAWRKIRSGPPRCLECGSTSLTQETTGRPGDLPRLEHPGCGGQLVQQGLDYEQYDGPELLVDSEGQRIDQPQQP